MNRLVKNILVCFLTASIVFAGVSLQPRRAQAVVPEWLNLALDVVTEHIWPFLRDVILKTLRKRIMDYLVNSTVKMIQNYDFNKDPSQILDYYRDVLENTKQAAVGDIVHELFNEDVENALCRGGDWGIQLQLQLTPPAPLGTRVECTLDDILESVEGGFEGFIDKFENGGWIAYTESLKPQNNLLGVQFITHGALLEKVTERLSTAEYEAETGSGILGAKNCLEWKCVPGGTLAGVDNPYAGPGTRVGADGSECSAGEIKSGDEFLKKSPDGVYYNGKNAQPGNSAWICAQAETVTPGSFVKDRLSKVTNADIDWLIDADQIGDTLDAILNAVINRAITEGVGGLARTHERAKQAESCEELRENEPLAFLICDISRGMREASDKIFAFFNRKAKKQLEESQAEYDAAQEELENVANSYSDTGAYVGSDAETEEERLAEEILGVRTLAYNLQKGSLLAQLAEEYVTSTAALPAGIIEMRMATAEDALSLSETLIDVASRSNSKLITHLDGDNGIVALRTTLDLPVGQWGSMLTNAQNRTSLITVAGTALAALRDIFAGPPLLETRVTDAYTSDTNPTNLNNPAYTSRLDEVEGVVEDFLDGTEDLFQESTDRLSALCSFERQACQELKGLKDGYSAGPGCAFNNFVCGGDY